jgi:AcrR family transcriptional regulator
MSSNETRRKGNPRGHGSNLRAEILTSAERLLATASSRDAVTLRAIAREAGIAAPSIYPHFPDRDAILDAVVARTFVALADTCQAAARTAPRGIEAVEAISIAYVAFARENPGQYRILFERSPANIASPPHQYPEGINAFQLLVNELDEIAAKNGSAHQLQPMLDAQTIFAALHGIAALPPALPAFPWLDEATLIRNVLSRVLGRASKEFVR